MISARLPNAAAGKPPPITLPNVIRSGTTPSTPYQPERVIRNPVITSSETNSAPCSRQVRATNALKSSRGGTTPMFPGEASVMTAAIWSPYDANAAVTAAWSLYGDQIAAVITEASPGNMGVVPPRDDFN